MPNPLSPSDQPGARPASEHRKTAREIGNATREAERILDDIAGTSYDGGTAMRLVSVLRRLTNAIRAVRAEVYEAPPSRPLTDEEMAFAIRGGVPARVFTAEGLRDAEDWLVWSEIRNEVDRQQLDQIADRPLAEVVPGLREAIDAFPSGFTDLDKHAILRTPDEDLDGLSPIQWLLTGREPAKLVEFIEDLGLLP